MEQQKQADIQKFTKEIYSSLTTNTKKVLLTYFKAYHNGKPLVNTRPTFADYVRENNHFFTTHLPQPFIYLPKTTSWLWAKSGREQRIFTPTGNELTITRFITKKRHKYAKSMINIPKYRVWIVSLNNECRCPLHFVLCDKGIETEKLFANFDVDKFLFAE